MKKIISLLLVLVLCVGMLSTVAFAEEEMYDIIEFDLSKIAQSMSEKQALLESLYDEDMSYEDMFSFLYTSTAKSKNGLFTLTVTAVADEGGWFCGTVNDISALFTITAVDGLKITRIEAEIGDYAENYDGIVVSGNASKQTIFERNGVEIAPITNIDSSEFSFTGGNETILLKDITVYYTGTHTHSYGDDGKCSCGTTKCEAEGHSLENGFCKFCDFFDETKHTHDYQPTVYTCQSCGEEAPAGYVPEVPGGSTGSTLSQGNMTIVCSVATLALGLVGGLLIGKKRKPAAANGANSEDEE